MVRYEIFVVSSMPGLAVMAARLCMTLHTKSMYVESAAIGRQLITARAVPAQEEAQPTVSNNVIILQAFFLNTGFAMVRRYFSEASCNV